MKRKPSVFVSTFRTGVVALAILCANTHANEPYLVKDINPAPGIGGYPEMYTVVNGKFLLRVDAR